MRILPTSSSKSAPDAIVVLKCKSSSRRSPAHFLSPTFPDRAPNLRKQGPYFGNPRKAILHEKRHRNSDHARKFSHPWIHTFPNCYISQLLDDGWLTFKLGSFLTKFEYVSVYSTVHVFLFLYVFFNFICIFFFVYLFLYLFSLFICLFIYSFIFIFIYFIYLFFIYLFICIFIFIFIYLYIFIYWFIYLYDVFLIYWFIYLCIYLLIFLFYLDTTCTYIYIYTCFCEMLRADPSKKCQAKDAEPGAAWEPVVGWWSLVVCGVYQ